MPARLPDKNYSMSDNNGKYMIALTDKERIAKLETNYADIHGTVTNMDAKLDDLLALRNKGLGAFWVASFLTGTGIIGLIDIIRSHFH